MSPIPRLKPFEGPPVLSYGFRPFFLLGSLYAGAAILVWLPMAVGDLRLYTLFSPRDWHVHEMLFGYLPAAVTGFLLTAIPNWTGRLPLQGLPLLLLATVWILGRIAVSGSAALGWGPAAAVDLLFLALVWAACAREIVAGRNWRNLKVLVPLGLLLVANAVFHLEAALNGTADYGVRLGMASTVFLLMVIGGRIVPSFTRNWLARRPEGRMPASFGRFDAVAMALGTLALIAWVVHPGHAATGVALLAAAVLQAARLARWGGERTWADRLVLVLHVAYAFVPLGFALVGLAAFGVVPPAAGLHAWGVGAVGGMTLAVMSRASLGHTGRALRATPAVEAAYALCGVAAVTRIVAAVQPDWAWFLLVAGGIAWSVAFLGFALAYWPVFTGPRLGRPSA